MSAEPLLELLQKHEMAYQIHEHEPAFTVNECQHLYHNIAGAHCKTLFLKDKKKSFFLLSILHHKQVDLKALSKIIARSSVSFGSAQELAAMLKVIPGSVTPYALMHDSQLAICCILDKELLQHDIVNFHPLRNDMTLGMKTDQFLKFLELIRHSPTILDIPTRE